MSLLKDTTLILHYSSKYDIYCDSDLTKLCQQYNTIPVDYLDNTQVFIIGRFFLSLSHTAHSNAYLQQEIEHSTICRDLKVIGMNRCVFI